MRPSQRRRLIIAGIVVALLGCTGAAVTLTRGGSSHGYEGDALSPALPRPRAILTDTSGAPYDFASRTSGKATLLYFGYTHCPDVCPTTMADVHQALEHVDQSVRSHTQVVFVSVDPDRDSLGRIRHWLDGFDPAFIGLRAPIATVVAVGDTVDAGVTAPTVRANGTVDVQHGGQLVGLSPEGGAPVFWIPSVDGSSTGPSLQKQLEHDLPLLVNGVGA